MEAKDGLTLKDLPARVAPYVRVNEVTGCWEWLRYLNPTGYGEIRVNWKLWLTHRFVWSECVSEIPPGLVIMHTCDNPKCLRPLHLQLGTHNHNNQDKVAKGRQPHGEAMWSAKFTQAEIDSIRARVAAGEKQIRLSEEFGVNRSCISKIISKSNWSRS